MEGHLKKTHTSFNITLFTFSFGYNWQHLFYQKPYNVRALLGMEFITRPSLQSNPKPLFRRRINRMNKWVYPGIVFSPKLNVLEGSKLRTDD